LWTVRDSSPLATPSKRSFRLTGADGAPLRGAVTSAAGERPVVVVCHGLKGFKDWGFFPYVVERLARAGFAVVSFNFSGSGVGEVGNTFYDLEQFARKCHSDDITVLITVYNVINEE